MYEAVATPSRCIQYCNTRGVHGRVYVGDPSLRRELRCSVIFERGCKVPPCRLGACRLSFYRDIGYRGSRLRHRVPVALAGSPAQQGHSFFRICAPAASRAAPDAYAFLYFSLTYSANVWWLRRGGRGSRPEISSGNAFLIFFLLVHLRRWLWVSLYLVVCIIGGICAGWADCVSRVACVCCRAGRHSRFCFRGKRARSLVAGLRLQACARRGRIFWCAAAGACHLLRATVRVP